MFKSGAVSVTKAPKTADNKPRIPEQQSVAVSKVESSKPDAAAIREHDKLERHLPYWLGSTHQSLLILVDIFTRILPNLITDKEMHAGIVILRGIASEMSRRLEPTIAKYGENKPYGEKISTSLRDMLFPAYDRKLGSYEVLATLQALKMYYSHVEGHLLALFPTSKALWDKEFTDSVEYCQKQLSRLIAWADNHLKVKAPQSLLVPNQEFRGADALLGQGNEGAVAG
jgi:ferredoxin-nitrate reductase